MAINLNFGGQNGGIKKLIGIYAGIMSGGAAGAAAGIGSTAGSVIGGAASANPKSPLGQAAGIYGAGKQIGQIGSQIEGTTAPKGDAMTRSLQAQQQIEQGLQHLNDPAVYNSMPYDHYIAAVEPLLRAKHYGMGGGMDSGGTD